MNSRLFLERLDCLLTGGALLALGRSLSAVFFLRRALWRCRRALQLRLSPSKDVTSWKRPHCWQKRWRFPSLMMLLTCCTRPESSSITAMSGYCCLGPSEDLHARLSVREALRLSPASQPLLISDLAYQTPSLCKGCKDSLCAHHTLYCR